MIKGTHLLLQPIRDDDWQTIEEQSGDQRMLLRRPAEDKYHRWRA